MKVVMGSCATLLAFALIAPTAVAAKPRPPRDTTPPSVPQNVRVVAATEDSITLRWDASTDDSGRILRYMVNGIYHDGSSTTKTITGLVPNYTSTYRVSAVDPTENESARSAPLTATTAPDVTAPTAPTGLRLTATTPSSVSLAWTKSTDRWAFGYQILMNGQVIASAASVATRLRHLEPGSTPIFTVRARDTAGNLSGVSNALTVALPASADTTPPSAPANLTAVDLADFCGGVILSWGQSSDNADPQTALEYEIYRNGAFFSLVTGTGVAGVYAGSGTSTWTVIAVDRSGRSSAASNPATVTVFADENLC